MSRDLDEAAAASAAMEPDTTHLPDAWEAAPNEPTPMTDAERDAAMERLWALQQVVRRNRR